MGLDPFSRSGSPLNDVQTWSTLVDYSKPLSFHGISPSTEHVAPKLIDMSSQRWIQDSNWPIRSWSIHSVNGTCPPPQAGKEFRMGWWAFGNQQWCRLRPSVLGQDRSQTKKSVSVLVLVLQVWCCVVKHGLVTLVVVMIFNDSNFSSTI